MLIDTTLREGEQAYGVYFEPSVKARIARELALAGIEEIELGWVGQEDLPQLMRAARAFTRPSTLAVWAPMREDALEAARELAPDRLSIGVPVSDGHIAERLGLTRSSLIERVVKVVGRATALGVPYVSVGLEDVTRADPGYALAVARAAMLAGARRIRLADTVGCAAPMEMAELVRRFRSEGILELAVHCHDDFGMASANAVTALAAGAAFADASVLGLGERAGIAPLEEVAAFLALRSSPATSGQDAPTRYDLPRIRELCRTVAKAAGRAIEPDKSVAGSMLFACESGLHVHGLTRRADLFEPFAPESIGAGRVLGVGKKSGAGAVRWALGKLGIRCAPDALGELVRKVRGVSAERGRPLAESELKGLALEVGGCTSER
jgi:homocitrate synthase NifV